MKDHERDAWDKIRQKGVYRYVLINGALSYGLPMFVVTFFLIDKSPDIGDIFLYALAWLIGGLIFGLVMWRVNERRFRASQATDNDST